MALKAVLGMAASSTKEFQVFVKYNDKKMQIQHF
jgi:hypothetical protein